jgi:cupin fold WbuC family metalloprotein
MKHNQKPDPDDPRALPAPATRNTIVGSSMLEHIVEASRKSSRGRIILPFHKNSGDRLQRMLNALQPESYIQPHRHENPPKSESILVLRGSICFITFTETGDIEEVFFLRAESPAVGIDSEPGSYHTFFALEPDTVLFEVKPGPYGADTEKQSAPWSPAESSDEAGEYFLNLKRLAKERQSEGQA